MTRDQELELLMTLTAQREELRTEVSALTERINELACKHATNRLGAVIGDRVKISSVIYEVTDCRIKHSRPTFYGRKVLLNGGLHKTETDLYGLEYREAELVSRKAEGAA